MSRSGIRLTFDPGVCQAVKDLVREVLDLFAVHHRIVVCVSDAFAEPGGAGGLFCIGCRGGLSILVCGGLRRRMTEGGETRTRALAEIGRIAAHEMVHYEQFRDGRPLTERGVEIRALSLLRKARPELARDFFRGAGASRTR